LLLTYSAEWRRIFDICTSCARSDQVGQYYQWFLDVEFMVFLGFGGLMTFLRRYSYSAIAFNFLISAFVIMCGPLLAGHSASTTSRF